MLIYPIGDADVEPEDLMAFNGWTPLAKAASGFGRIRARCVIELFALNDWERRKELLKGRARQIQLLYLNLDAIVANANAALFVAAKKNVVRMLSEREPHANCLRSFARLFKADRAQADAFYVEITEYLSTIST